MLIEQVKQDLKPGRIELLTTHENHHQGLVVAVGAKVYGIEVGDTVLVSGCLESGVEVPGGRRLVSQDICVGLVN